MTGEEVYPTLYSIRESPVQRGLIWTGSNDGPFYVSRDNGVTWRNITGNLADVPLNSIKVLRSGSIVAGSDLGVVYTPSAASGTWFRLGDADAGTNGALPLTVVNDLEVLPNGDLYAATYGRGIWKIGGAAVGATPADGGA